MEKTVYVIDSTTREYLGTTTAPPDPLELAAARRSAYEAIALPAQREYAAALSRAEAAASAAEPPRWLLPANTTDIAPLPPKEGHACVLSEGEPHHVEDHRGTRAWRIEDATPMLIETLGPLPGELTLLEPPPHAVWNPARRRWAIDREAAATAFHAQCITAVTAHLDATAQAMGYDDMQTAVTYADEPAVPRFQREGRALRAWRSAVWAACYAMLEDQRHSKRPQPTLEALIAALPQPGAPA